MRASEFKGGQSHLCVLLSSDWRDSQGKATRFHRGRISPIPPPLNETLVTTKSHNVCVCVCNDQYIITHTS